MKTTADKLNALPPLLRHEAEDFIDFLSHRAKPPKQRRLRLTWAGALRDLGDEYTALELQKKSLEWWGD
jgi:hypothetical protein